MKITKWFLFLVTVLSFSYISIVSADNRQGAFVLTPGLGAYIFDSNRGIKNHPLYNVGLGYDFNTNWGIEALAGTVPTSFKGFENKNITANFYSLDGVYHFNTNNPLVPYLLAGAGILDFSHADIQHVGVTSQANFNAGAGLEYFLGKSLALRSDVRDIYTPVSGRSDVLVNFGVSLLLGGQTMTNPVTEYTQINPSAEQKVLIRFSNGSTSIDPIYKTKLQQIVSSMKQNNKLKANIDGYTAENADPKRNLYLSQLRSDEIKEYLVKQNEIDASRINAQGFGEGSLLVGNHSSKNKQSGVVVITLIGR